MTAVFDDADLVLTYPLTNQLTQFNEMMSSLAAILMRLNYSFVSFATAITTCAAAFRPYNFPLLHQYHSDHAAKLLSAFGSINADTAEDIVRDRESTFREKD